MSGGGDGLERRITTGIIVSSEFIRRIRPFWKDDLIESPELRRIARWGLDHFENYGRPLDSDLETLFFDDKLKSENIPKDEAEFIEKVLRKIGEEFGRGEQFNAAYLYDRTVEHLRGRELEMHAGRIADLKERGQLIEAERVAREFKPTSYATSRGIDVGSHAGLRRLEAAFDTAAIPIMKYPGAYGDMINAHLIRGGFVSLLANEKRGKCLPGDQRVLMENGDVLPLAEVVSRGRRDLVAYDERRDRFVPTVITDFHSNGVKKVFAVTTRTGRRVKVTHNHPFLTPNGWIELKHLLVGDFVAAPKNIPIFGTESMPEEEIRLLAYFLADGCLGNANGPVVGFTKADPDVQRDFERCVSSMDCKVFWDGIDCRVVNSDANRYRHNKNHVRTLLSKHGMLQKRSYEKTIPEAIYRLSKNDLKLFLSVLMTCDGWAAKGDQDGNDIGVGFAVSNELFARQVQELLSRFGIVSRFRRIENDYHGAWEVAVSDYENVVRFADEIGFLFGKGDKLRRLVSIKRVSYRSFLDKFPPAVARRFYDEIEREFGVMGSRRDRWSTAWCDFSRRFKRACAVRNQIAKGEPLMRQTFLEVADTVAGRKYFDSAVLWDEIVQIEFTGAEETFDLTVADHHNFVAENVLVHNTWSMIDLSTRALIQRANVAFFQAGDLTEGQFLRRFAIHVARCSDDPTYSAEHWRPIGDCAYNQFDTCTRSDRNCDFGVHDSSEIDQFLAHPGEYENLETIVEMAKKYPDYRPCDSDTCDKRRPTVWLVLEEAQEPLTGRAAKRVVYRFFNKWRRRFRLATYASGTLTTAEMDSCLDEWERQDDFVPDLIVVDYADLMTAAVPEFRHRQDEIWKGLRGISQKRHALLVTATQADAAALKQHRLNATNFSEDKRKLAHVTAMFGMHQSPDGREKSLGMMRFNAILTREGSFSVGQDFVVLQDLASGRPFLESYACGNGKPPA